MRTDTPHANTRSGRWLKHGAGEEGFSSFVPKPLPPKPPLQFSQAMQESDARANRALGRLDGVSPLLPNPGVFLYTYVRKEAVLSSQIEGTQSSLSDLLVFESEAVPGVSLADVEEVSRYVRAMNHGLTRLRKGFPLSLRLLRDIHGVLMMRDARGGQRSPGEFRRTQNWIGGSRPGNAYYVPPPAHEVLPAMGALEKFLHDDPVRTPVLIKAGLAHVQFESIHPFLDGNGRMGRLLITLLLCAEGALQHPLLYLSLYFKKNRTAYYEMLQRVRTHGEWERWMQFYLEGVAVVAIEAAENIRKLHRLFDRDRQRIQQLGRAAVTALRVHELLKQRVVLSAGFAARELEISFPAVAGAMAKLGGLGIVREFTGRQRNRMFAYQQYLAILEAGTEPL